MRLTPGLQVRDWTQENAIYFRAIGIEKTMMGLILMLIVAVAVFNIVATLVMVVNDKRTDIAILRTLGMSPREVLAVFMTQGVLIGWVGTALGVALGLGLAFNVGVIVPFLEHTFGFHIMDDPTSITSSTIPSEPHMHDVVIDRGGRAGLDLRRDDLPVAQGRANPARRGLALRMNGLLVRRIPRAALFARIAAAAGSSP